MCKKEVLCFDINIYLLCITSSHRCNDSHIPTDILVINILCWLMHKIENEALDLRAIVLYRPDKGLYRRFQVRIQL